MQKLLDLSEQPKFNLKQIESKLLNNSTKARSIDNDVKSNAMIDLLSDHWQKTNLILSVYSLKYLLMSFGIGFAVGMCCLYLFIAYIL